MRKSGVTRNYAEEAVMRVGDGREEEVDVETVGNEEDKVVVEKETVVDTESWNM